jgi:hypothetical protein
MNLDEIPILSPLQALPGDPDDQDHPAGSDQPPKPEVEIPPPAPIAPSMDWGYVVEIHGDERGGQTPKRPGRAGGDDE